MTKYLFIVLMLVASIGTSQTVHEIVKVGKTKNGKLLPGEEWTYARSGARIVMHENYDLTITVLGDNDNDNLNLSFIKATDTWEGTFYTDIVETKYVDDESENVLTVYFCIDETEEYYDMLTLVFPVKGGGESEISFLY